VKLQKEKSVELGRIGFFDGLLFINFEPSIVPIRPLSQHL
jgi:hypothetical protein